MKKYVYPIGRRVIVVWVLIAFVSTLLLSDLFRVKNSAYAAIKDLPSPSKLLKPSQEFQGPMLKGIYFNPDTPSQLEFILDPGDSRLSESKRQEAAALQVRYFIAGLVTPAERLWVNLSPYEEDKVVVQEHQVTELGRDMLKDDYLLKLFTSSLTHPDSDIGKNYWKNYVGEGLASSQSQGKIWIKPGKIDLYSKDGFAVIENANLVIESEIDSEKNVELLDAISKEVNTGRNFTRVRQLYNSLILAFWFKKQINGGLFDKYVDSLRVKGIDVADAGVKDAVYALYKKSFEKGVYDLIRGSKIRGARVKGQVARDKRRYFSGGMHWKALEGVEAQDLNHQQFVQVKKEISSALHIKAGFEPVDSENEIEKALKLIKKDDLSAEDVHDVLLAIKQPECSEDIQKKLAHELHTKSLFDLAFHLNLSSFDLFLEIAQLSIDPDVLFQLGEVVVVAYIGG